jgi:signal transduction histidine kinase/CheY-like chemotaxis protein/HPt (histidine-containing phosphotransfer) domain-containing protein
MLIMMVQDIIKLNYRQFLFVFLAFFIMVTVSYFYTSSIVGDQLRINGQGLIQVAEANIQAELSQSEVLLTDTALYIEYLVRKGGIYDSADNIAGIFALITDRINNRNTKNDVTVYGLTDMYGFIQGRFISGVSGWNPPADYDPLTRPWYAGAREADGAIHYTNIYTDRFTGKSVVSLSRALFDRDGLPIGVLAVDVDLSGLAPLLKDLGFTKSNYYSVVLDRNLTVITHGEDKSLIGRDFATINKDCARLAGMLKAEQGVITGEAFTNYSGTKSVIFFEKIENGWYNGVISATASYYAQVYQMGLVIAVLGFALMLSLSSSLVSLYTAKIRSEEKNKSKSNFLARMSHEIRTPMNAIVGLSELILREDAISHDIYDHALGIKQAGANLLSIINDILDFSKIESGKMEITEGNYLLASVINDVVTIIRMRLSEKPVLFLVYLDAGIPNKLVGDEVRIRQILLNILNNAVKYTEKGSIAFSIEGGGSGGDPDARHIVLEISVADTGIGIKEENFAKVFGDFAQFDKAANKGIEGTGLGLAITKSLCDAMGGEISFKSEYGRGTDFKVYLPQQVADAAPLAEVRDPEEKSVLIYEMDERYARSVMRSLDNLGVPNDWVTIQSDFYETVQKAPYAFIFVSHILYEGAKKITDRMDLRAKTVLMTEYGAEVGLRDVNVLAMPAHALSVADILNNKVETRTHIREAALTRFIAPRARILIVDDISTNLKVAEGLMSPFKMRIETCKSGAEAVEMVKKPVYDIVFMDHMMPEMDGIEATRIIRRLGTDYHKSLPIIALTANAVSGVKEMFMRNGMNDFLSKPIEMTRLTAMLQKWIPQEKQEKYYDPKKSASSDTAPEAADAEAAEAAVGNAAELPAITGIDAQRGIAMTGGTLESYRTTLGIFLEDGKEKIGQIQGAFERGDIALYTTYVHAIKSAAGSIGAAALSERARDLENAGRKGDRDFIAENTPLFIGDFGVILEGIGRAIGSPAPSDAGSEGAAGLPEECKRDLAELRAALDGMETGRADEIMARLRKGPWGKEPSGTLETIAKHILLSDYDEAALVIDALLSGADKE